MKSSHSLFRALRHRNYRIFFAGQGLSLLGTWIQQTAEVWLAYRLTHSALALGIVGFAGQIPTFLLASLAGAWVDRSNKRRLVIIAQFLEMAQGFALAILVLTHHITYHWLILLSVFGGIFDALEIPSRQSFVYDMVDDHTDLANAIALNSSLVNMARLVGPAIAGLLIGAVGEGWCFFLNACSYLGIITSLLFLRIKPVPKPLQTADLIDTFRQGIAYVARSVPIRTLLATLTMISLMSACYSVLIPVFAVKVLHGGAHTLGFLMTASGLGAVIAALRLASRPTVIGLGSAIAFGIFVLGAALIVFSFSYWFLLSWLIMAVAGFGMMTSTASINTILQTIVDADKRGRVMSFFTTAFIGMAPLGNIAGGWIADYVGAPIAVRFAGIATLIVAVFYWRFLPRLRGHIRPIYHELGILSEMASGIQVTSSVKPRG